MIVVEDVNEENRRRTESLKRLLTFPPNGWKPSLGMFVFEVQIPFAVRLLSLTVYLQLPRR